MSRVELEALIEHIKKEMTSIIKQINCGADTVEKRKLQRKKRDLEYLLYWYKCQYQAACAEENEKSMGD